MITITNLTGSSIKDVIPELAKLRIGVFREFPYLYEGSEAYEEKYLRRYAQSEQCIVVLVRDGGRIVGASTGMPLSDESEEVIGPVRMAGHDIHQWFYLAESVLLPEYRGRRIGHRFFEDRLRHALEYGYETACFCAVVRPSDHPRRPAGYRDLHGLWGRHGFEKADDLSTHFSWKEIGEDVESTKPMEYWVRKL